jgi:phosphoribosylanthranilate isomerase
MWIKIDGCMTPEDALAVGEAGADAFGMVLANGFRRTLTIAQAARVRAAAPPTLMAVGIFVGQSAAEVAAAAEAVGLDALQLHGAGADALYDRFRGRYRVLRAWDMQGAEPTKADWLVVEPGAGTGGGTGRAWDWGSIAARRPHLPFFLAGGLTVDTVEAACAAVRPDGVDVSSGVETDGRKDPDKIARFCAAVRRWQHGRAPAHQP